MLSSSLSILFSISLLFVPIFNVVDGESWSASQDPITIVRERLYSDSIYPFSSSWVTNTEQYMRKQLPQGNFSDVNYLSGLPAGRADWDAANHISRTLIMTKAVMSPPSPMYKNANVLKATLSAVQWWFENDYKNEGCTNYNPKTCPSNTPGLWNPNWWWNMIGIPQSVDQICILLQEHLTPAQADHCHVIMHRANYTGWTGANTLWMAAIQIYDGAFRSDASTISRAFSVSYSQLTYAPASSDGIKQDGAFMQHDGQIYNGGYGADFVSTVLNILYWSAGTSFAPTKSQQEAFSTLIADGTQWMISYGSRPIWDINVKGREITRDTDMGASFNSTRLQIATSDWARASDIAAFCKRLAKADSEPPLQGNKIYWTSDYAVHHRPNFFVSLKMFSTRTRNSECVNSENLLGLHLADGALYTYLTGHEYDYIFPAWDWNKIPGITVDYKAQPLECSHLSTKGRTTFVGGVSDGVDGIAVFDFLAPFTQSLNFQKSWFFFGDIIIVLVANVTCRSEAPVYHVLDSRDLSGTVTVSSHVQVPFGRVSTFSDIWWLHHNNIGYIFPTMDKIEVNIDQETVKGDWSTIGVHKGITTSTVFTAWLTHAQPKVMNDSLIYFMVPGIPLQDFESNATKIRSNVEIVANSPSVQAISDLGSGNIGVVFWRKASVTFKNGFSIASDVPCVVLVKGNELFVSDPTQKLTSAILTINRQVTCSKCSTNGPNTDLKVTFPQGMLAGSTVKIAIQGSFRHFNTIANNDI